MLTSLPFLEPKETTEDITQLIKLEDALHPAANFEAN